MKSLSTGYIWDNAEIALKSRESFVRLTTPTSLLSSRESAWRVYVYLSCKLIPLGGILDDSCLVGGLTLTLLRYVQLPAMLLGV